MPLNSNNQQVNQVYTKEDAYQSLEMINTWISNIDTKVSFALALVGVIIGFVMEMGMPVSVQKVCGLSDGAKLTCVDIISVIIAMSLYIVSFLSIISFLLAVMARVENLNRKQSIFFFGSIGQMSFQNYRDIVKQMTEQEIIEDLEEQIHTNSKICIQKVKWYGIGMNFLVATIITWFICMFFRLI